MYLAEEKQFDREEITKIIEETIRLYYERETLSTSEKLLIRDFCSLLKANIVYWSNQIEEKPKVNPRIFRSH